MGKPNSAGTLNFYPRPPRGGRPLNPAVGLVVVKFLPTPSTRRATQSIQGSQTAQSISTHALHEEGDLLHECPSA